MCKNQEIYKYKWQSFAQKQDEPVNTSYVCVCVMRKSQNMISNMKRCTQNVAPTSFTPKTCPDHPGQGGGALDRGVARPLGRHAGKEDGCVWQPPVMAGRVFLKLIDEQEDDTGFASRTPRGHSFCKRGQRTEGRHKRGCG